MARVALYYPWMYLRGGAERLIRELVVSSRHDWTVYTNHFDAEGTFPEMAELDIVELERVSVRRSLVPLVRAAAAIRRQRLPMEGHDALVVVCEGFGDLVTFANRSKPVVCLCLTPLKIIHDEGANRRLHAHHSLTVRLAYSVISPFYRRVERSAWRTYRSAVAISGEVKRRIVSAGLMPGGRVTVAYPGVVPPRPRACTYGDFFLIAGRIMWEKDIELGIEAFRRLRGTPAGVGSSLTIAGYVDEKSGPYLDALRRLVADLPVEIVPSPSAEELADLYASCRALVFTAPNEEFGLVTVEAMACGKPVVAVARGGPAEIVRDQVDGYLVRPEPDAMADAMARLASSEELTARLGARARQRAAAFTWERFSAAVDADVDAALGLARVEAPVAALPLEETS